MSIKNKKIDKFLTDLTSSIEVEEKLFCSFENSKDYRIFNFDKNKFGNFIDLKKILNKEYSENKKYKLIVANLPINSNKRQKCSCGQNKKEFCALYHLSDLLSEDGLLIGTLSPSFFYSNINKKFINDFHDKGYSAESVFKTPKNTLEGSSLRPYIIIFKKGEFDNLFIAEITNDTNIENLIKNYTNKKNSNNVFSGLKVSKNNFQSFKNLKLKNQLNKLDSQFKDYKNKPLGEVSKDIITNSKEFKDLENCLYMPTVLNSPKYNSRLTLDGVNKKYYSQIILNKDKILSPFLLMFLNTDLGNLSLKSKSVGLVMERLRKKDLKNILVPIPDINEQKDLINTRNNLKKLKKEVNNIEKNLFLYPKESLDFKEKIDDSLEKLNSLNDVDKVHSLIRKGENKFIEFKETFSLDIKKGEKKSYIEKSSLKNIVGFMNSEGGTLLIGVSDNGEIKGIEKDYYKGDDDYLLHFKNKLKSKIGEQFYPLINYKIIDTGKGKVLQINCKESNKPVYFNDKEFFVRTNPATDKLEGRKLQEYIENHFN